MIEKQLNAVWEEALGVIKSKLNTPTFKTWFENTAPVAVHENTLIVSTPNSFAKEWLETRYRVLLCSALFQVLGKEVVVKFVVRQKDSKNSSDASLSTVQTKQDRLEPKAQATTEQPVSPASPLSLLNPKYTFDSFIIGGGNRFAHAAALAVAEQPSQAYNPLFIYGGVGLGKTHLLQAIGHYILQHHPQLKIRYVSSEKFTNDFINSIRDKEKIAGFQTRYRSNDVLLIDDIQFLENKEATQEEFFHTFNTLYQADKQIVISSDRPPKDIATLEDRLRSRFEWGLITDIQPPDLETRIAILKKKSQTEGLSVPDDVLEVIASRIQSNIRELEGALIRIIAFSSLTKSRIDTSLANEVLKDIFPEKKTKPITVQAVQKEVCQYFNLQKAELIGNKRSQVIVYPRQVAMYLSRELTDLSLPKIGELFGGRDHTTVMHANTKIRKLINEQREVYNQIQEITNRVKQKV